MTKSRPTNQDKLKLRNILIHYSKLTHTATDLVRRIAKDPQEVTLDQAKEDILPVCATLLRTCQYLELCMEHRADDVQELVNTSHTTGLGVEDQKAWNEIQKKRKKLVYSVFFIFLVNFLCCKCT